MTHTKRLRLIKIVFAIIIILLLFLPASVNHPQIDMRALVAALGIDAGENPNEIIVSLEIILPVEGGGSQGTSKVTSKSGSTIAQAINDIGVSLGRKPELSHCGIVVLGNDYAKNGVTKELEYLLSSATVCPQINLTVSANSTANEFLQALSGYSQKLDLSNLLRYTDLGVQNYSRSLVDFLRDCRSPSATGALPCFKMGYNSPPNQNDEQSEDNSQQNKDSQSEDSSQQSDSQSKSQSDDQSDDDQKAEEDNTQAIIENAEMTAVFTQQGKTAKLKCILQKEQTYGMAWLDRRTKKGYVFVDSLSIDGTTIHDIPLTISGKKIKKRSTHKDGKTTFEVSVDVKLRVEDRHDLSEFSSLRGGIIPKKVKNALQNRASEIIAQSIKDAYQAAKQENADIMLIEDEFFRHHNRKYKALQSTNHDFLKTTDFKVNCTTTIS